MIVAGHLMVWALLAWAPAALAQQGGDLQAQILYAYQTKDTNSLANLIQDLTARLREDAGDASLRHHAAHAQYRRGLPAGTDGDHWSDRLLATVVIGQTGSGAAVREPGMILRDEATRHAVVAVRDS